MRFDSQLSLINLPDVFNRVQFRRTRRQEQQSNVVRDAELRRDVPSGLIEDEDHASAVIDCLASFPADVDSCHRCRTRAVRGPRPPTSSVNPNGAEGRVPRRAHRRVILFLTYARFVGPPEFDLGILREAVSDGCQCGSELFLKAPTSSSFWAWWRGLADSLAKPRAFNSRPTVVSSSEIRSWEIKWTRSLRRQRTTPSIARIWPRSTILARAWR